jgi:hypothetical protein
LIISPTVRAEPDATVTVRLVVLVPAAFPAVRVTVKVPAAAYVWVGFCSVLVPPSPKFQDHVAGDPVETSVNCTDTFAEGDAGEKEKDAVGLDDGEDDDEDDEEEDESPHAAATSVPSRMAKPARQAREGSVCIVVMDAS